MILYDPELENKITDLLPVAEIHVAADDGLTVHRTTKSVVTTFVVATSGSPLFILELDNVSVGLTEPELFFLQEITETASTQNKTRALIIFFIIIFFRLTLTDN